jgi:hypothetical protein
MMAPISRKAALIAECEQQRLHLFKEAEALKVDVQAFTQRTQHYALLAIATVGVSFGIWLALRARTK